MGAVRSHAGAMGVLSSVPVSFRWRQKVLRLDVMGAWSGELAGRVPAPLQDQSRSEEGKATGDKEDPAQAHACHDPSAGKVAEGGGPRVTTRITLCPRTSGHPGSSGITSRVSGSGRCGAAVKRTK